MSAAFLFFAPIGASWLLLYAAAVARSGNEQAASLGFAAGLIVAWGLALRRRDVRNKYETLSMDFRDSGAEQRREAARRLLR